MKNKLSYSLKLVIGVLILLAILIPIRTKNDPITAIKTPKLVETQVPVETPSDADPKLVESRALVESFANQLQLALKESMERDGPVGAITVCKDIAPQIESQLSRDSGAKVERTSLRFRNSRSAPEPWQSSVLNNFESAKDNEQSLTEYFIRSDSHTRYMKAITMKPLCLVCHGPNLPQEIRTALANDYQHDRAQGYQFDELRGAFSVTWFD